MHRYFIQHKLKFRTFHYSIELVQHNLKSLIAIIKKITAVSSLLA